LAIHFRLGIFALFSLFNFAHTWPGMNQDEEHLNLLSVFHYIVGGLGSLMACLPLIQASLGALILFSTHPHFGNPPDNLPASWFGILFLFLGGGLFLLRKALAISVILSGRFIAKRKRYNFVFVIACIQCLFIPFGTLLGIFTLIVLTRPSVKVLFGCAPGLPIPPPRTS